MSTNKVSSKFNRFSRKIVSVDELKTELKEVYKEESGLIGGKLRSLFIMNPDKMVDDISCAIQRFIIFSNNPEAGRLSYSSQGDENKKIYLDAEAVCDVVSNGDVSETIKQSLYKAVERVPDHAPKIAAGLIKKF